MNKYGIRFQESFDGVLTNCDDQVIVRCLLNELVPEEAKAKIILNFNKYAAEHNLRIIEVHGHKSLDFAQRRDEPPEEA